MAYKPGRPTSPESAAARVTVIGIAGGSGAGKTTLSRSLASTIGEERVLIIGQDRYYRDLSHLDPASREDWNFDHPWALDFALLRRHLQNLLAGRRVALPSYDFASHTRRRFRLLAVSRDIVIVEGTLILHDSALRQLLDLTVYVDAPEEVRVPRRIARDVLERGRTAAGVRRQMSTTVLPMHETYVDPCRHLADVRVDGAGSVFAAARLVKERMNGACPWANGGRMCAA